MVGARGNTADLASFEWKRMGLDNNVCNAASLVGDRFGVGFHNAFLDEQKGEKS